MPVVLVEEVVQRAEDVVPAARPRRPPSRRGPRRESRSGGSTCRSASSTGPGRRPRTRARLPRSGCAPASKHRTRARARRWRTGGGEQTSGPPGDRRVRAFDDSRAGSGHPVGPVLPDLRVVAEVRAGHARELDLEARAAVRWARGRAPRPGCARRSPSGAARCSRSRTERGWPRRRPADSRRRAGDRSPAPPVRGAGRRGSARTARARRAPRRAGRPRRRRRRTRRVPRRPRCAAARRPRCCASIRRRGCAAGSRPRPEGSPAAPGARCRAARWRRPRPRGRTARRAGPGGSTGRR